MHGDPEGMINATKIKKIQNTAQFFLNKYRKIDKQHDAIRIDVIAIVLEGGEVSRLNFYENVGAEFA